MGNIYIIVEGEKGKSQSSLWHDINRVIYKNGIQIVDCQGIKTVRTVFDGLYHSLSIEERKDSVFLFDIDNVYDNAALINTLLAIEEDINRVDNAFNLGGLCFEYNMLSFKSLEAWVYCRERREHDSRIINKINVLKRFKRLGTKWKTDLDLSEMALRYYHNTRGLNHISTENMSNILLVDFTVKTSFFTEKGRLGKCFRCNCKVPDECYYSNNPGVPKKLRCGLKNVVAHSR